ncbi:MAG: ATP-binding cassette domain-containing protein [Bacteroidales bacterium]
MIEVKNLSFKYDSKIGIFESLHLDFQAGNIYGLLGENGVGKTTFLRLLSGLLFPNTGTIEVMGFTPQKRQPSFLEQIYYLPEVPEAPSVTFRYFVKRNAPFYPNFSQEQLLYYMEEFGVNLDKKLSKNSHGQHKKAMISFALACNTPILLLDEPTNGLDIPSKGIFRRIISRASNENKCFIISTHQVRDLENMIDPIVILEQNQILLNNSIEEITNKLWFGVHSEKRDTDLYVEEAIGGYAVVGMNVQKEESKVNIEMLFNAAIQNKQLFKRLFIEPKESCKEITNEK